MVDPGLTFLAIVVGILNMFVLLILLGVYVSSYRKIRSSFTLGLIGFSMLLLLQNIIFIIFMLIREGFRGHGVGFSVLSVNLCQLGALLVLLRITWE
ncbi:hypothetical protein [Methanothermobacter sp.]|uniref:hypothetical protein n=1 Tax=Methanothermobacter sp. TaxID=1884223 RepID=UPI002608F545|nr:hypothetical protein [Methanothermobacter sp.]MDI9617841.1 hypothetical protein [Methanothermobacter sp.]